MRSSSQLGATALQPGPSASQQPYADPQLQYQQSVLPGYQWNSQPVSYQPSQIASQEYSQQNHFRDAQLQRSLPAQQMQSGSAQDYSDISFEPLPLEASTASLPAAPVEQDPDDLSAYEAAEQHYEDAVQHSLLWNENFDQVLGSYTCTTASENLIAHGILLLKERLAGGLTPAEDCHIVAMTSLHYCSVTQQALRGLLLRHTSLLTAR